MTRSLIYSALLALSPRFCALSSTEGSRVMTFVVSAWEERSCATADMYTWVRTWLEKRGLEKALETTEETR